ncbi:MAG: aspartyl-phosphate phosphatase Spo0E family protein [Candidatus Syntrophopropionicum ammoniitolerans]
MEQDNDKLAEIERLRTIMHKLANEGEQYQKILAISRELDTLIVQYQKQLYLPLIHPTQGLTGKEKLFSISLEAV